MKRYRRWIVAGSLVVLLGGLVVLGLWLRAEREREEFKRFGVEFHLTIPGQDEIVSVLDIRETDKELARKIEEMLAPAFRAPRAPEPVILATVYFQKTREMEEMRREMEGPLREGIQQTNPDAQKIKVSLTETITWCKRSLVRTPDGECYWSFNDKLDAKWHSPVPDDSQAHQAKLAELLASMAKGDLLVLLADEPEFVSEVNEHSK